MAQLAVDISGRLDDFGEDTTIGFSNDRQGAIRLSRLLKQEAIRQLRRQGKGRAFCKARLYVIGLYLLLRPQAHKVTPLVLDKDLAGWEGEITSMLVTYLRRQNAGWSAEAIRFASVEDHPCHTVANRAFRGKFPTVRFSPEEFLGLVAVRQKKNRVS